MNFFELQDRARRNTAVLVGLFATAVLLLVAITILLAAGIVAYARGEAFSPTSLGPLLGWDTVAAIAATIVSVIVLGSLYKLRQLSAGGRAVAESLGGRKINIAPRDELEQRALNVVEEMSIASGTPVPDVYVIEDPAINAFAAGQSPADAVIGLTRGCIERLSRDELQGVVAHEFSHIFNGDMRLNLRIVGLLHGILIIGLLGYWLLRGSHVGSSRDNRGRAALLGIGAGLMVIGYTGTFFGNLIKSAVSRQREFLADASAVQFTRNNTGIAGALKKIGGHGAGSTLASGQAAEFSHMYFAGGLRKSFTNLFATHPPLPARIRRLDPGWNGHFPAVRPVPAEAEDTAGKQEASPLAAGIAGAASLASVAEAVDNTIANPDERHTDYSRRLLGAIPAPLHRAARDPFAARAVVYRLMLHRDTSAREQQLGMLRQIAHPAVIRELEQLEAHFHLLPDCARLPLIDLCIPALKALAPQQYQVFKRNLIKLLRSDRQVDLWEWALYRLLMHALEGTPDRQRLSTAGRARGDAACFILAAMAHAGNSDYLEAKRAFDAGLGALQLERVPLPARRDITLARLDKAVAIAAGDQPLRKPRLLKAMAATMAHDGVVAAEEIELLRAVADSLDCPMPPVCPELMAATPREKTAPLPTPAD
ncbi:M48 family metallopeptidase [Microbulbifer yueqingensis]|uniref:Zn-dependent protease with chaperone function n=1 Tax=Microbulbifer yueqingensis TaxID=658219 RepID=A0A1G8VIL7_9GAMM|nr:M48 family metallopeptidase [Microbulbifer yueqingensis]SDJ65010.1 Zn-dependent protease with chaperone function [Microbulbifer yueqingensis]